MPKLQQLVRSLSAQKQALKKEEHDLISLKAQLNASSRTYRTQQLLSLIGTVDSLMLKIQGLNLITDEFSKELLEKINIQRLNLGLKVSKSKLGNLRKEFVLATKGMSIIIQLFIIKKYTQ